MIATLPQENLHSVQKPVRYLETETTSISEISRMLHQLILALPEPYKAQMQEHLSVPELSRRFVVKKGHQIYTVPVNEIAYVYSRNKITRFKTTANREFMLNYSLEEMERMLPPNHFFRINRNTIISFDAIRNIHLWFHGKLKIEVEPATQEELLVSRERVPGFRNWLGIN